MNDSDKTTAIERLEGLLNEKDAEIENLSKQVEDLEERIRGIRSGWMEHKELPRTQTLPVPRLEMLYEPIHGWSDYETIYQLVYRHFLGHCVAIPLGRTSINSSSWKNAEPPMDELGRPHLPFRDGAHIKSDAKHLNVPAFVILGDKVTDLKDYG
jgi:hypothetical protein